MPGTIFPDFDMRSRAPVDLQRLHYLRATSFIPQATGFCSPTLCPVKTQKVIPRGRAYGYNAFLMTAPMQILRFKIPALALLVAGGMLLTTACAVRRPAQAKFLPGGVADLQKEIVSKLEGTGEIRPGITLANRNTLENRQEVRNYLAGLFQRFGMEPRRQGYGTEGENIFTVLPCGRPAAETVVFGAHYDSARNTPGANDNATGVAAVAAVAQEMSRVRGRRRDMIFVFFDEEERGLRGSRAFAQMLKDEKRPVQSVHTIDQTGWDQDGDGAIELEIPYEGALELYQKAAIRLQMKIAIYTTAEAGSDHSAFRAQSYKAVGITEEYRHKDTTPFIHRPGDTFDTVNLEYLRTATRLVTAVMESLVSR